MLNTKNLTYFLSLRWKATWLVILFLLVSSGSYHVFLYSQMKQQFNEQISETYTLYANSLLEFEASRLIELTESILVSANSILGNNPEQQLANYIENNWFLFQISWDLDAMAMIRSGTPTNIWGELSLSPTVTEQVVATAETLEPQSQIYCSDNCLLYSTVPLLSDVGESQVLLVAKSIPAVLSEITRISELNFILATNSSSETTTDDGALNSNQNPYFTNQLTLEPIVAQLNTHPDFSYSAASTLTLKTESNNYFYIFSIPLMAPTETQSFNLYALADITDRQLEFSRNVTTLILISLLSATLVGFILITFLSSPLRRLSELANLYPLLINKNYSKVHQDIKGHHLEHRVTDEIDILDEATDHLASELERMNIDVEIKTRELESMALYDPLTGLANRRLFELKISELISAIRRYKEHFTVMFIDLDKFKPVNDLYGHEAGDEVLKAITERLTNEFRQSDTVARIGGDEFAVLLPRTDDPAAITLLANRVLAAIKKPIDIGKFSQHPAEVSGSLGIAISNNTSLDADHLINLADKAMYSAKEDGGDRFQFAGDN